MSDETNQRGPADAQRINLSEDYEVRYWTKTLGISEARLREAVGRVGVMAQDVRADLGQA